jgi:trk system potassium uptake protein TrkA
VNDPENEKVFRKLGVGAISTTRIVAGMIEQRAALDQVTDLLPVGEGEVNITQVEIQRDAPAAGKKLKDLALPPDSLIAAVLRGGRAIIPRGDTELREADRIVLITLPASHGAVLEAITGQAG